jgi:4-amino-4-deoxy-L-arabinose transferase-like glycosyltransferase
MNRIPSVLRSSGIRALLVGIIAAAILILTTSEIGLTWDEPAYIAASESYVGWFQELASGKTAALQPAAIENAWSVNHEHPPFNKELSGLVWALARNITDDLLARRLANILLAALAAALLYHMMAEELGEIAGWAAAAALLAMPRFFFHAHLAALDVPTACMVVIVTYVFWRTRENHSFWPTLLLGIVFALAVATKVNAAFVMPTLFIYALLFQRRWYLLLRLALASVIALPLYFALWPWLYYDTIARLKAYIDFQTVTHWKTWQYFLHEMYMPPPWYFSFVTAWAVIPLGTTALYFLGIARAFFRRKDRGFLFLLILNALVPLLVLAARQSQVYDGERMFMPAFPFLAALAGAGFAWAFEGLIALFRRIRRPALGGLASAAAALIFLAPPVYSITAYYPHLLSYYSESVGGLPGAARLGLETTYWCETYREAIQFINEKAQPGDSIWAEWYSVDVLVYYQIHGFLRKDLRLSVPYDYWPIFGPGVFFPQVRRDYADSDFVIFTYRQSVLYDESGEPNYLFNWASGHTPAYRVEREGVPIMEVYWNP